MKTLTRLGTIILALAISLLFINLMRNGNTTYLPTATSTRPDTPSTIRIFLAPRNLNLQVSAPSNITLTILDPSGTTILEAQNITTGFFTLSLEKRGYYNFSVSSPPRQTAVVEMNMTLYDLDKDVTLISIILAIAGAALILAHQVRIRLKKTTDKTPQHSVNRTAQTE
jgi:hypothetical protein